MPLPLRIMMRLYPRQTAGNPVVESYKGPTNLGVINEVSNPNKRFA